MKQTDSGSAFIEINELFNSIENENMDKGEQLSKLRDILNKLDNDCYKRGISRGINEAINNMKDFAIEVNTGKVEL